MTQPYIGQIKAFPYDPEKTPRGWLLCNGRRVPISEHEMLFAVIGHSFGGDENQFRVPTLTEPFYDNPLPGSRYFIADEGVPPIPA